MNSAHEYLLEMGYKHAHVPESWEDVGDAENGPMVVGNNAYDMYLSDEDIVYVCDGHVDYEKRDPDYEKYCDEMDEWLSQLD